jgi:hypothetical protein
VRALGRRQTADTEAKAILKEASKGGLSKAEKAEVGAFIGTLTPASSQLKPAKDTRYVNDDAFLTLVKFAAKHDIVIGERWPTIGW